MQQIQSAPAKYTLDHAGHRIEVEVSAAQLTNLARLFVDGQPVATQQASLGDRTRLDWNDVTVVVQWGWWAGHVARCVLVEQRETGQAKPEVNETPFAPPPGTRAARLAQFQREHPALYASRHVALATLKLLLPLLGLGALLTALLPRIDFSWATDIGAFARSLRAQIGIWIPDISLPFSVTREWIVQYVKPWITWGKWVLPIIIAMLVAIEEVQRHKRKQHRLHGDDETESAERSDRHEGQVR